MNTLLRHFAHAGEAHESTIEAASHSVFSEWYIAVPLFVAILAVVCAATWLITKKDLGSVLFTASLSLLIGGFAFGGLFPLVSVISIVVGMCIAGFLAVSGITSK